ncbi:unnamed protein product [Durusdinium trenchii]|uniref:Uncharacterized protein n=1 Tax=Durusdinium trenchii TaxID=1381693 RepID=A0ABP0ILZ9_9DINO
MTSQATVLGTGQTFCEEKVQVVGEIMAKPPFKDDLVPIPFTQEGGEDQLLPGEYVGYTRRQVCYLAAKALMGATFDGYNDGLSRYLSKEGPGGCLPRKGAFGKVLWSLLMSCVADPSLQDEKPGPELLVVKQQPVDMSSERLQQLADMTSMSGAALRVCRYEEGSVYKMGFLPGVPKSPPELCSQPSTQRGVDYLSTSAMGQAAVLPSSRVGGQIYGSSCGGGGLDENIMLFMPEVAVLSLLLSESKTQPQLQAPAWVLGARMIMTGLDGTGHWMAGMVPDAKLRLTSDLTTIHLNGAPLLMSKSKPFVAVPPAFQVSFQDVDDLKEARQNRNLDQRAVKGQNSFAAQAAPKMWLVEGPQLGRCTTSIAALNAITGLIHWNGSLDVWFALRRFSAGCLVYLVGPSPGGQDLDGTLAVGLLPLFLLHRESGEPVFPAFLLAMW